jgi:hypothetical protein
MYTTTSSMEGGCFVAVGDRVDQAQRKLAIQRETAQDPH